MERDFRITTVEDYERYVGAETVERILAKAKRFRDLHVVHINSTDYGGGVAELLSSKALLMNSIGIKTGWRVIQGCRTSSASRKRCTMPFRAGIST